MQPDYILAHSILHAISEASAESVNFAYIASQIPGKAAHDVRIEIGQLVQSGALVAHFRDNGTSQYALTVIGRQHLVATANAVNRLFKELSRAMVLHGGLQ